METLTLFVALHMYTEDVYIEWKSIRPQMDNMSPQEISCCPYTHILPTVLYNAVVSCRNNLYTYTVSKAPELCPP